MTFLPGPAEVWIRAIGNEGDWAPLGTALDLQLDIVDEAGSEPAPVAFPPAGTVIASSSFPLRADMVRLIARIFDVPLVVLRGFPPVPKLEGRRMDRARTRRLRTVLLRRDRRELRRWRRGR